MHLALVEIHVYCYIHSYFFTHILYLLLPIFLPNNTGSQHRRHLLQLTIHHHPIRHSTRIGPPHRKHRNHRPSSLCLHEVQQQKSSWLFFRGTTRTDALPSRIPPMLLVSGSVSICTILPILTSRVAHVVGFSVPSVGCYHIPSHALLRGHGPRGMR